jgi:hypothetical protein
MRPFNASQLDIRIGHKASSQALITPDGIKSPIHKSESFVKLTNNTDHDIAWVNVTFAREHNFSKIIKRGSTRPNDPYACGGSPGQNDPSFIAMRYHKQSTNDAYGTRTYNYHRTGLEKIDFKFHRLDRNGGWSSGWASSPDYPLYQSPWVALAIYGELDNKQTFFLQLDKRVQFPIKHDFAWRCFVATAAYQDYDHPMVKELRIVRDEVFARTKVGRTFIAAYYRHGPKAAAVVAPRPALRLAARTLLTPIALAVRGTRRAYNAVAHLRPK